MRGGRSVAAVTDADFDLAAGECLALVGESGCGKSVLASALLGLLPGNAETEGTALLTTPAGPGRPDRGRPGPDRGRHDGGGRHDAGGRQDGRPRGDRPQDVLDLLAVGERTLARAVRGRRIGLVPQSPAAHLTPVRTVRAHLEETVRALTDTPRRERRAAAEAAAERAAFPAGHLDRYPHELSGGLAQRAATALALVGDAPLLLADEPTTGLDRELVDRTADELRRHADRGKALLLITHDLAAARRVADRVAVMYAGRIVEIAPAARFFGEPGPRHPYARGLLDALPEREFTPIPGLPPALSDLPEGCAFAPRCARASAACAVRPEFLAGAACHHPLGATRA
ncbi:oligopeptide/dipeptide ABC transporter ATP-binding protein [Streptomyces sp. NPDC127092]|uniref:oligopeptide/dipeptide ABC transporter ATP-binding protein n=1 Tax=Streptomyces sp. NPDC127092 TaxID=3347135 RepID=UPI003648B7EB